MQADYYIEPSQMSVQMMNELHTAYNLPTFHWANNLCILLAVNFQTQILDVTFLVGPVDLQPA